MHPHLLHIWIEILNQPRLPLLLGSGSLTRVKGTLSFGDHTLTIDWKDKRLCLPIKQESSGHFHLQFYSPNFILQVHLHKASGHGHQDMIKDMGKHMVKKAKKWEDNFTKAIDDLNRCEVCTTEHNCPPRPKIAAKTDSTTKKALKRKLHTDPTKVNTGEWVYFKRNRDRYWKGPVKVVQKDRKSLHCIVL